MEVTTNTNQKNSYFLIINTLGITLKTEHKPQIIKELDILAFSG